MHRKNIPIMHNVSYSCGSQTGVSKTRHEADSILEKAGFKNTPKATQSYMTLTLQLLENRMGKALCFTYAPWSHASESLTVFKFVPF